MVQKIYLSCYLFFNHHGFPLGSCVPPNVLIGGMDGMNEDRIDEPVFHPERIPTFTLLGQTPDLR